MTLTREILIDAGLFIAGVLIGLIILNFQKSEAEIIEIIHMPFTIQYYINWDDVDDIGVVRMDVKMIEGML